MIIYSNTITHPTEPQAGVSHGSGYKLKSHKKPKSIKSTASRVSTSKSRKNKLKPLQKENILFLSELGFKVKKK